MNNSPQRPNGDSTINEQSSTDHRTVEDINIDRDKVTEAIVSMLPANLLSAGWVSYFVKCQHHNVGQKDYLSFESTYYL